eukprot:gene7585-741_t
MQDFTRRLLAEQNDVYEVSLAADHERAQRVEEESRKAEEERKALKEAEEKARREAKRGALPAEPALDAAGGVALVRVRLPDGSNCSRRFLGSHTIGHVFDLVYSLESTNYAKFDLVNNCPRQVYSSPDFGTIHSLCECPAFCPCRFDLVSNCPRFGLVSNYLWQVYSSPECGTRHNLCDFLPFALAGSSSSATAPGENTAHLSAVQYTTYASVLPSAHAGLTSSATAPGSTSSATTPDKCTAHLSAVEDATCAISCLLPLQKVAAILKRPHFESAHKFLNPTSSDVEPHGSEVFGDCTSY